MVFKHSHLEFQQRCLVGPLAPCILLVCYTAERKKTKHFGYYDIHSFINSRTYYLEGLNGVVSFTVIG